MIRSFFLLLIGVVLINSVAQSQPLNKKPVFTRQDSLRGTVNAERSWWDVLNYAITVQPSYESKSIKGSNDIRFKVLKPGKLMQIDLQSLSLIHI